MGHCEGDPRALAAVQRAQAALSSRRRYDAAALGVSAAAPLPDAVNVDVFLSWVLGLDWPAGRGRCDLAAAWGGRPLVQRHNPMIRSFAPAPLFRPVLRRGDLRLGDLIVAPATPTDPGSAALVTAVSLCGAGRAVACSRHYERLFGTSVITAEALTLEQRPLARLMRPDYAALARLTDAAAVAA